MLKRSKHPNVAADYIGDSHLSASFSCQIHLIFKRLAATEPLAEADAFYVVFPQPASYPDGELSTLLCLQNIAFKDALANRPNILPLSLKQSMRKLKQVSN